MNLRTSRTTGFLFGVAGIIVAVALAATAGERGGNASDQNRPAGAFSGRLANDITIYQLPSITVVASRKAELAKIEEQSVRASTVPRETRRTAAGGILPPGGV